jgi:hypothetical protein
MATRITRTTTTPTLSTKCTFSAWVKRADRAVNSSSLDAVLCENYIDGNNYAWIRFDGSDKLNVYGVISSSAFVSISTNRVFRDTNAWYHIVCVLDSTESTSSDRLKIYVNGVRETSLSGSTYPGSSDNIGFNRSGGTFILGDSLKYTSNFHFDGLYSHVHFIDGAAYQASTFGSTDSTTGEWKINTSPTIAEYGANGFFMFKDDASLNDDSGKGNNFTVAAGSIQKTEDNPSNVFCTLNFLNRSRVTTDSSYDYLKQGNTTFDTTGSNATNSINTGTIGVTSGKYYWEYKVITNTRLIAGITTEHIMTFPQPYYDETDYSAIAMNDSGQIRGRYTGSAIDQFSSGTSNTTNDIIGVALDMDNKALYIHKNGTYLSNGSNVGVPTSGSSRTGSLIEGLAGSRDDYIPDGEFIFPVVMDVSTSGGAKAEFNFGNGYFGTTQISSEGTNASNLGKFEYDVPAGYTAICTKGLNE